jgi:hypothetical protein
MAQSRSRQGRFRELDLGPVDYDAIPEIEPLKNYQPRPQRASAVEITRRRVNLSHFHRRPVGRAPRRPCNARTRGSRRVTRAGPSSSDDPPGESDHLGARAAL